MYANSLAPSKVFGIVLLLFSGAAILMWLGFLPDEDAVAFDLGGLVTLGSGLCLLVLSILFLRRVRWVRVVTSILLHLLVLVLLATIPYALTTDLTISEKTAVIAVALLGAGLLFIGILVLHASAMRQDLTGVPAPQRVRRSGRRTCLLVAAGCTLLFLGSAAWYVVPLLVAKPTTAVDYLAQANQAIKPIDYDPNRNAAPHYEKLSSQFMPLPEILRGRFKAWPADLLLNEYEALKEWAPANEPVLPVLAQAARCPYWWYELTSSDGSLSGIQVPDRARVRDCVQGLILLAKYKASRGDVDGALRLLADVHMLGVHHAQRATLVDQLTGAAVCQITHHAVLAIMDRCQTEKDTLRRTLDAFASQMPLTHVPRFSEMEHLYVHDHMQRVFTDDGSGDGRLIPGELYRWKRNRLSLYTYPISFFDAVRICLTHPSRLETTRLSDMSYAVVKGLAGQTPWNLHAQGTSCEGVLNKLLSGNYYLHEGYAATAQCIRVGWQDRALGDGLVTVLAILAYKAQEGRLPESLDQVVTTGLLQRVPTDSYSGKPLVYKVKGDDFILYSAGEDFVDDGGVHCGWNDIAGGDYVFWPVQYPVRKEEGT